METTMCLTSVGWSSQEHLTAISFPNLTLLSSCLHVCWGLCHCSDEDT